MCLIGGREVVATVNLIFGFSKPWSSHETSLVISESRSITSLDDLVKDCVELGGF